MKVLLTFPSGETRLKEVDDKSHRLHGFKCNKGKRPCKIELDTYPTMEFLYWLRFAICPFTETEIIIKATIHKRMK